jgi:hypothetical protein
MPEISYYADLRPAEPVLAWDPWDLDAKPFPDCGYLGGVFRAFEREWDGDPLTVYVTKNPRNLPSVGDDVVAVLLNDEWFRAPAYSGEVLAVLRHLALAPWFPWGTLVPPSVPAILASANHLRLLFERWRYQRESRAFATRMGWRPPTSANSIDIPLGYYRQPERPIREWSERGMDVYFGGSLIHDLERRARWKRVLKQLLGNPKQLYRKRMLGKLDGYRRSHPDLRAKVRLSRDFRTLGDADVTSYADDMMDARFALVPRGTAAESYRLFEAWRYGTVPIAEQLPPRPFYQGAPYVELRDWRELEAALDELLHDPARAAQLHERALAWWRDVCSEEVVGSDLARRLSALRRRSGRQAEHERALSR